MFYGEIERPLGKEAMGRSFVGIFQDEHPPTPRDIYTERLAEGFRQRFGYEIGRAIPALHFDVGPLTPKYRTDFFDAYLEVVEATYWKRVYDWTERAGAAHQPRQLGPQQHRPPEPGVHRLLPHPALVLGPGLRRLRPARR